MNAVQQKEVVALVTWLQTFPEFSSNCAKLIADGQTHVAVESLVSELDRFTIVRYVTLHTSSIIIIIIVVGKE
jgi:hypothetical protein